MKKFIYCLVCLLLFSLGQKTEAATLQKEEVIQFEDTLDNQTYKVVSMDYPERAKGWSKGVYHKRKLDKSYANKYFYIEQGNLVAQSQYWEEPAPIGKSIAYANTGGLIWDAENADYEIEATFVNPTKDSYQVFVTGNSMLQTDSYTIHPNQSVTVKFTISVVYGKLELSFIVPQKVTAIEKGIWKNAYIKQVRIHKKDRENKGRIPTIFIAGDSTAATMDRRGYFPREGWGQELYQFIKHHGTAKVKKFNEPGYEAGWYEYRMNTAVIENRATSGESTNNFRDTGKFDSILNKIKPGDFVLVQFSHNDIRTNVPQKNTSVKRYKENLRYFAEGVKQRGGKCIFLSSVPRWKFTKNKKVVSTALPYRRAMKQIAREYHIPFLNIGQIMDKMNTVLGKEAAREFYMVLPKGTYSNYPAGLEDASHFRSRGAKKVAQVIAGEIQKNNIKGLSSLIKVDKNYYKGLSRTAPIKSIKKKNGKKIEIRWKNIKRADHYNIFKYSKKSKKYVKIGTTKKNFCIVKSENKSRKYLIQVKF